MARAPAVLPGSSGTMRDVAGGAAAQRAGVELGAAARVVHREDEVIVGGEWAGRQIVDARDLEVVEVARQIGDGVEDLVVADEPQLLAHHHHARDEAEEEQRQPGGDADRPGERGARAQAIVVADAAQQQAERAADPRRQAEERDQRPGHRRRFVLRQARRVPGARLFARVRCVPAATSASAMRSAMRALASSRSARCGV